MILANDALISSDDQARRRIVKVRQFIERYVAGPFAIVRRAVIRKAAVAGLANWNASSTVISNVTINISVDKILSWAAVAAQSCRKLIPVSRAIQFTERQQFDTISITLSPPYSITIPAI